MAWNSTWNYEEGGNGQEGEDLERGMGWEQFSATIAAFGSVDAAVAFGQPEAESIVCDPSAVFAALLWSFFLLQLFLEYGDTTFEGFEALEEVGHNSFMCFWTVWSFRVSASLRKFESSKASMPGEIGTGTSVEGAPPLVPEK